ncbi:MAG: hypothetical protein AAGI08_02775 [Bacteroidota bacterium]
MEGCRLRFGGRCGTVLALAEECSKTGEVVPGGASCQTSSGRGVLEDRRGRAGKRVLPD